MRKYKTSTIALILLVLFPMAACKTERTPDCITIDVSAALSQTGVFPLSDMVSDIEVIQLDTVRDAFFGNMNSLSVTNRSGCGFQAADPDKFRVCQHPDV